MLNKEAAWGGVWVKDSTFRILGLLPGSGTTPEQMLHRPVTQFPSLPSEILRLPFPMLWQTDKICSWYHPHPCIPHPTNCCNMFPVAQRTPTQGRAQGLWAICAIKNPCAQGLAAVLASSKCKSQDSLDAAWLGAGMEMQD